MSQLTRLQARLTRTTARLTAVEQQYDNILAAASSTDGETAFSNQSLADVERVRATLENEVEALNQQIDALQGSGSETSLATFQLPGAS